MSSTVGGGLLASLKTDILCRTRMSLPSEEVGAAPTRGSAGWTGGAGLSHDVCSADVSNRRSSTPCSEFAGCGGSECARPLRHDLGRRCTSCLGRAATHVSKSCRCKASDVQLS